MVTAPLKHRNHPFVEQCPSACGGAIYLMESDTYEGSDLFLWYHAQLKGAHAESNAEESVRSSGGN